jgi:hypothetical protein
MTTFRATLLLLVLCNLRCAAQEGVGPIMKIRVAVEVSANDDDSKDVVTGYIKRELRKISDVDVVSEKQDLLVECVVAPCQPQRG